MTYDQGSEMSLHKTLTKTANIAVYFAHPHSPWERGISENTNGLLRDYLPKGTDLSLYSQKQLDAHCACNEYEVKKKNYRLISC